MKHEPWKFWSLKTTFLIYAKLFPYRITNHRRPFSNFYWGGSIHRLTREINLPVIALHLCDSKFSRLPTKTAAIDTCRQAAAIFRLVNVQDVLNHEDCGWEWVRMVEWDGHFSIRPVQPGKVVQFFQNVPDCLANSSAKCKNKNE